MQPEIKRCQAKLPHPAGGTYECRQPVEYRPASPPEVPYSGWRHINPAITDHNAVQGVY